MCYVMRDVLNRSVPLVGCPAFPFIDQGGAEIAEWEKEEKPEAKEALRRCRVFPFLWASPADMADGARDSPFTDLDRAMLWLRSTSGHVPSYPDRRHCALGC